jgi:hypothetical protein
MAIVDLIPWKASPRVQINSECARGKESRVEEEA